MLDGLLIFVGILMAIASGFTLPGHMILLGKAIELFIAYDLSETILTNRSTPLAAVLASMNTTGTDSSTFYFCEISSDVVRFLRANDSDAQLQSDIGHLSIYYVVLGVGAFITSFLATSLMNCTAYRQTKEMRLAFFRSILRQEISWFDVNPTAELNNRLSE